MQRDTGSVTVSTFIISIIKMVSPQAHEECYITTGSACKIAMTLIINYSNKQLLLSYYLWELPVAMSHTLNIRY